MSSPPHQ